MERSLNNQSLSGTTTTATTIPLKHRYVIMPVAAILIILIGTAYIVMGFHTPLIGDDLGFRHTFAEQNDCLYALPRSMYRHWIWNNARMADMLNPIGLYYMPVWLRATTNGLMTSLMFLTVILSCGRKARENALAAVTIISLIAFTFRWDALWMEYCTSYNYVWSTAFALSALLIIFNSSRIRIPVLKWAAIPFCFVAAAMHEACGFPLAVGMTLYFIVSRKAFTGMTLSSRLMSIAFISGGIFTLTSPASYSRIGFMLQPEHPAEMLLLSAGYVLILLAATVVTFAGRRQQTPALVRSPWLIFATAAILSTCFMLLSQYGGRTGWFAQTFALIALFRTPVTLLSVPKKAQTAATAVLSILIVAHYSAVVCFQIKTGNESAKAIGIYRNSPDGIIFMDYADEPQLPWYILRKTHGVPDEDDTYYRYRMAKHYGNGKEPVILPESARGTDWHSFAGTRCFGNRIISDAPLPGRYTDRIFEMFPRTMIRRNGIEYIEQQFVIHDKKLFLYSPVDRDRGEK